MVLTENILHPLTAHTAQEREVVHKNYIMSGLQELQANYYQDNSVSNSSAYFTIKPPLGNTLMDRNILLELTVQVVAAGGYNFGTFFAPK